MVLRRVGHILIGYLLRLFIAMRQLTAAPADVMPARAAIGCIFLTLFR
jgi:hypothetical protein